MRTNRLNYLRQRAITNALTHWCPRSIDESVPPVSDSINETGMPGIPNLAQIDDVTGAHMPHVQMDRGQATATWLSAKSQNHVIELHEWKRRHELTAQHHTNRSIAIAA